MSNKISVKVVTMEDGLKEYDDVSMVRVKSKSHTLLIMEDYLPVIGQIDGQIDIIMGDRSESIQDVVGFYMHKKNLFRLLVTDRRETHD